MKNMLFLGFITFIISACNSVQDAAQNTMTSAVESAIESQTGQKMDLADAGSFEDNAVKASFQIDGTEKITSKSKMVGTIMGSNEEGNGKLISFQFQDEEGTMIMVNVSKIPNNFNLPFNTKMYKQNEAPSDSHSAMVTYIKASESGMYSYLSFGGTLTINELNNKASISINGKAEDAMDLEKPENWKHMKASFVITSPIIQTIGFDKNEIIK
jgi:hypothetical protein